MDNDYLKRPNASQALGRFSRGLVKTVLSPVLDFPGVVRGLTDEEHWKDFFIGFVSAPEIAMNSAANTYYYGYDSRIQGEDATEIILPSISSLGITAWMGSMAYNAAQVSSFSELNTTGYIAAGCYVAANALTSLYRILDRG